MKSSELSPLTVILAMQKVKKRTKKVRKELQEKNYKKKKDFTQVVSLSVLYFGAKNCDQISL